MKIDYIGNFYLLQSLSPQELSYLNAFTSSSHFDCSTSPLLGLYDVSVSKENLSNGVFNFSKDIDLVRTSTIDPKADSDLGQSYSLFPFFNSPATFAEKSIKFSLFDIQSRRGFLFFMTYLSRSILFYYHHFFKKDCYSKTLDSHFFSFFKENGIFGNVYFKLSEFGEIYRLTASDDSISLFKGTYPAEIRGKTQLINSNIAYEISLKRQLTSFYDKISNVNIKKNTIFEGDGEIFNYSISEQLEKMLHFKDLSSQLSAKHVQVENHSKIHKI